MICGKIRSKKPRWNSVEKNKNHTQLWTKLRDGQVEKVANDLKKPLVLNFLLISLI